MLALKAQSNFQQKVLILSKLINPWTLWKQYSKPKRTDEMKVSTHSMLCVVGRHVCAVLFNSARRSVCHATTVKKRLKNKIIVKKK